MQTVPLISDAVIFRFLHSHKTGLHLNHAEKSLNHILRVLISREKHLKDISSSPDFSSSPQTPSGIPLSQWTMFSTPCYSGGTATDLHRFLYQCLSQFIS